jgi:3-hydroxyisobutyrate dehydrogenase-like beta-hydroxyacid dehydrogenase
MGQAMAARLLDAGHELTVYNRSRAAAEALAGRGARIADEPHGTLHSQVVISMLADDLAIEQVWITSGLVQKMPVSCVHLNMATNSLKMGKRLAGLHEAAAARYVAAPVFGRPHVAAEGLLDIVVAGPPQAIERCEPLFSVLGARWFVVGAEPHLANIVKIARNFMLASIVESLGEALALVRKSQVDPAVFLNVITSSSFDTRYRDYGRRMVEGDFGATFPLKLGLKDVELALEAAADSGMALPTGELLREQHVEAVTHGFGDQDWAALGQYIAAQSGL